MCIVNNCCAQWNYSDFNGAAVSENKQEFFRGWSRGSGSSRVRVCLLSTLKEFVMSTFISAVKTFIADEDGVTALEYGMIAALIAGAIVIAVTTLGTKVSQTFTNIANKMVTT